MRSLRLSFFIVLIVNIAHADGLYSASWALKNMLAHYDQDIGIYNLESQLQENLYLPIDKRIIAVARDNGLYLDKFYLKYRDKDILTVSEPFIAAIEGVYSFIYPKGTEIGVYSSNRKRVFSREDFVLIWDGEIISIPPTGVLLKRYKGSNQRQRIVFIYSYHKESFELFRDLFDAIYQETAIDYRPLIYVDELGLIPQDSIERLILNQGLTEREAFDSARNSLLRELKIIEQGVGVDDPTEFYHQIYDYFAKLQLKIDMEELQYENWKAIVAFDDLNLNQLAVTLFCRGHLDRYLDIIEQYNKGFWQYNVVIRDRFFLNQIERIAEENPGNTIMTLRGLGHFGIDADLDLDRFDVEVAIIGEGNFYRLFVPDQLVQILEKNRVKIKPDLKERYYLKAFLIECLRNYYQNNSGLKISVATVKANEALLLLSDLEIRRLARDIEHAIAEGRLRTTESVYSYVYHWIEKRSPKDDKAPLGRPYLLQDNR